MRGGGDKGLTVFLHPKGGGGGRYSQVFLYVDLDQASTVYLKKYQKN